jgi:hypothetical protein
MLEDQGALKKMEKSVAIGDNLAPVMADPTNSSGFRKSDYQRPGCHAGWRDAVR